MHILRLFALLLYSQICWSQNASQGKTLYQQNCFICHGNPSSSNANAKAANNPQAIRQGIAANVGGMSFLATLRDSDLVDIAAYIGVSLGSPTKSDTDRILDWAEATYPDMFNPPVPSLTAGGYTYRFYSTSNIYVGSTDGRLLWLGPPTNGGIADLGTIADWLPKASNAGF